MAAQSGTGGTSPKEGSHTFSVPFNRCRVREQNLTIWVETNQMSLYYRWLGTWRPSQCPPLFPGSGAGRSWQLSFWLPGELENSRLGGAGGTRICTSEGRKPPHPHPPTRVGQLCRGEAQKSGGQGAVSCLHTVPVPEHSVSILQAER